MPDTPPSLAGRLAQTVGADHVSALEAGSCAIDGLQPGLVVSPSSVEEVSQVLRTASAEGLAVAPWGGGTMVALGNPPARLDLALKTTRLDRILEHEPTDLTAIVEAGMTLEALQRELARHGQHVPLESPLSHLATVGGVLAANTSGPGRLFYGPARDWVIGTKVVNGDGTVTKAGGKVVKNVTGFDLNKLYIGSLGTLGVIVEVAFKLTPLPAQERTLVAPFPTLSDALGASQELLKQSFSPHALQVLAGPARERLGVDQAGEVTLAVLLAGLPAAVARKVDTVRKVIREHQGTRVDGLDRPEGQRLWQAIRDLGWTPSDRPYLSLRASVAPSQTGRLLATLDSIPGLGWVPGLVADPGFGTLRLLWWGSGDPSIAGTYAVTLVRALRQQARRLEGHVVVEQAPAEVKREIDVWGEQIEGLEVMRRIKGELDPKGILNPGRFAGRI